MNLFPWRRKQTRLTSGTGTAPAQLSALLAAQADVFERSGWGRRFVWWQPRNAAFWVFWVLVTAGAVKAVEVFSTAARPFASTVLVDGVMLAVYGALFWWITHTMDRYSTLPAALPVLAVLWGGFAATFFFAIEANDAILDLWGKNFGQVFSSGWGAGLTAPVTEEISKGLGLVLLIALAWRIVRTTLDAFLLGAFIGLGFQILEDLLYVAQGAGGQFGTDPFRVALEVLVVRMIGGVASHVAYSAIFATGLFLLAGSPAQRRRPGVGIGLMLTAMFFHFFWDSLSGILGPYLKWAIFVEVGIIVIVIVITIKVFQFAARPEREDMRIVLAPEVATGMVTHAESDAACATRRGRRKFIRDGGPRRLRRSRRALLHAVGDLAHALPVNDLEHISYSREEISRLRSGS